jgi:hypothetical protein
VEREKEPPPKACRHSTVSRVRIADDMGPFNAGGKPRRPENPAIQRVFSGRYATGRCGHKRLARGPPLVYSLFMPVRRIARTSLCLLIAYAIVLGGVLGPALGHGFDPATQFCAPGSVRSAGQPAPELPPAAGDRDCCPALCTQAAVLPPAPVVVAAVSYARVVHAPLTRGESSIHLIQSRSARAPPAG